MGSSYGRMERRAARPRAAKQSGGLLQSGMSKAIVGMAKDFHEGSMRRLDVSDLISKDGFDLAFYAALPRILDTFQHIGADEYQKWVSKALLVDERDVPVRAFDVAGFKMRLMDEAGRTTFVGKLADGRKVDGRADLFAVPLSGRLDLMEGLVEDADSLLALSRSFKACGLAGRGSSIVVSPVLIDPDAAGDAMPGQLRLLLELLQRPLSNPEMSVGEAVSAVMGIDEAPMGTPRDVLANRLLVGVRVQLMTAGNVFEPDGLVSEPLPSPYAGVATWLNHVKTLLPSGVQASEPSSFAHASAVMAFERILTALVVEGHTRGVDLSGAFDELHVCDDGQDILVSAIRDGVALGPASVPSMCAFADAAWFSDALKELSDKIVRKDAKGLMPTSATAIN